MDKDKKEKQKNQQKIIEENRKKRLQEQLRQNIKRRKVEKNVHKEE